MWRNEPECPTAVNTILVDHGESNLPGERVRVRTSSPFFKWIAGGRRRKNSTSCYNWEMHGLYSAHFENWESAYSLCDIVNKRMPFK